MQIFRADIPISYKWPLSKTKKKKGDVSLAKELMRQPLPKDFEGWQVISYDRSEGDSGLCFDDRTGLLALLLELHFAQGASAEDALQWQTPQLAQSQPHELFPSLLSFTSDHIARKTISRTTAIAIMLPMLFSKRSIIFTSFIVHLSKDVIY